jgi:serine/threonine protein phosphatase PrpC
VKSALLLGRDHPVLGELAAVAEGPAAISLSRGGAQKTYDYVEPNEDATLFAVDEGGLFVAVADGHHGAGGSQAVLELLIEEYAPAWTGVSSLAPCAETWRDVALGAMLACNHAVLAEAGAAKRPPAPTTLSFALVRPGEGLLAHAAIGDSHVFRVAVDEARDLGWAKGEQKRTYFLGYSAETAEGLVDKCVIGRTPLAGARAIVLVSDGLSERGIGVAEPDLAALRSVDAASGAAVELRALATAKNVSRTAMRAHREQNAGDNVCSAVIWLES